MSALVLSLSLLSFFPFLHLSSNAGAASNSPSTVNITLLGTTDLHGNLFPIDYYSNQPANRGLAKIATLVKRVRAEQPNTLLLDSGDTIQGTPLAYYFARKDTTHPNPIIAAMNALHYDAAAVGNHEFNFGLEVLWKAQREARFPMLAANIETARSSGAKPFGRFLIKNVAGVRVGIVGFITPGVPRWEIPDHYRGYTFHRIVDSARKVIPEVRQRADLVVVIAHSGFERDPDRPAAAGSAQANPEDVPDENAMVALAEQVPGIDVILFGHTHSEVSEKFIGGVLLAQARNWGQSLARADVVLERNAQKHWRVVSKHAQTIPVTDSVLPDREIINLAQPAHEATQDYLDTPIATSDAELDGMTARYEDHPFVELINKVQMEAGKADVSLATIFLPSAHTPAGKVTVRQIAAIYIYENTLYTVEMSGAQLREVLEHSASFFPQWPLTPGERIRLPGYNADLAKGVMYTVDLTQPVGRRIRDLTFKGAPLDPAQKLRVAINNYRYSGGGHYTVLKGLPIVYRSPQEIRELIIEHVSRAGILPTTCLHNWIMVPREAVEALIREARDREPRPGAPSP
ncbi:MAG: 5'-nucleotidase C-terminal domain-containing protein [Acidobacteria bacterium]|nr:5'-nucleotidase C-terminal domain-containing protein [Acidobacteriota bacterium]